MEQVVCIQSGTYVLPPDQPGAAAWPRMRVAVPRDVWVEHGPAAWTTFLRFVESGGYAASDLWPQAELPTGRVHDRVAGLSDLVWRMDTAPVRTAKIRGLQWREAWALCTWSQARLPLEVELKLILERARSSIRAPEPEWTGDMFNPLPLTGPDGRAMIWNRSVRPDLMSVRHAGTDGRTARFAVSVDHGRELCVMRRVWERLPPLMPPKIVEVLVPDYSSIDDLRVP